MKTPMTTQQAITMYLTLEALGNQFDRENLALMAEWKAKQNQPDCGGKGLTLRVGGGLGPKISAK